MRRREFLALVGSAAVWSRVATAQQTSKGSTVGYLGASTASGQNQWILAFEKQLSDLGWIQGRTVTIEYRWAEGRRERFAEIAAEFVRLKVDVIVTSGSEAVVAAKQATSVIPIVFASAGDPVGTGLVASLARPGGNVTGLSMQQTETASKRLELLREAVPTVRRMAVLANAGNPAGAPDRGEVEAAAKKLGLDINRHEIRRAEDIASAFAAFQDRVDALYVLPDPLVF